MSNESKNHEEPNTGDPDSEIKRIEINYDKEAISKALKATLSIGKKKNPATDRYEDIYFFYLQEALNEHFISNDPYPHSEVSECALEINPNSHQLEYSTGFNAGSHKLGKITSLQIDLEGNTITATSQDHLFESTLQIKSDGTAAQLTIPRLIFDSDTLQAISPDSPVLS